MRRQSTARNAEDERPVAHIERQRIDKWVWHARVVRTRPDAAELIAAGRIRLNGVREQDPAHPLKIGDVLTIALDHSVRVLKVQAFAVRRGGPKEAQTLYIEPK